MHTYNDIENGNATLVKIQENQRQFKLDLSEITTENPRQRKKDQINTIKNIRNLYNSKENVIKLFHDYVQIRSEAMYKTKHGTTIKILTPKEMLQRLPAALAQGKVR